MTQVDWLIAGTNAALAVVEESGEKAGLGGTPGTSEPPPERDEVPESAEATRVAQEGGEERDANLVDPLGKDGLEITPDKRELSPKREKEDVPETADATRVVGEAGVEEGEDENVLTPDSRPEEGLPGVKQKGSEGGGSGEGDGGAGESADAQRPAALPLPSPEALTSSPSPEARESCSSRPIAVPSMADISDGNGERGEVAAVPPSSEEPAADAVAPTGVAESGEEDGEGKEESTGKRAVDIGVAVTEPRGENENVPTDAVAEEAVEDAREGTEAEDDKSAEVVENGGEGGSEGARKGAGVEEESEGSPAAAVVEPAAVGGAPASLVIPEEVGESVVSKEWEEEEGGEESETHAVDAVVESSVFGRPGGKEREENGSLVSGHDAKDGLDPEKGEKGQEQEEREENGATTPKPIPEDGEEGSERGGGSVGDEHGEDAAATVSSSKDALGTDRSPESGKAAVAVEPKASAGAELVAEVVSSGEVLRSDASSGHGDGLEEKVLGSRRKNSGDVVGADGACVEEETGSPALDDVEL